MKSLSVSLGIIFLGVFIFVYAEVCAEDWTFYGRTDKYLCFYDVKSINHPIESIVEVSEKQDYTNEGKHFMVEKLGKKYENLSHLITSWQINCPDKKYRFLSLTYYSKEKTVIYSWKALYLSGTTDWSPFIAGSLGERLYQAVCK